MQTEHMQLHTFDGLEMAGILCYCNAVCPARIAIERNAVGL